MEVSGQPDPLNANTTSCVCVQSSIFFFSVVDIFTFLIGQPVVVTLLWTMHASKKTPDILSCSLAIFHNLQYWISLVHLCFLFLERGAQRTVFNILMVYAQTGGPMSLGFICFQRYMAVIYPTSYPLLRRYRYREVCVATVWVFSLFFALTNILDPANLPQITKDFFKNIPFGVMTSMTLMMVHSTIRTIKMLKKPSPESNKMNPAKRRALTAVRVTSFITLCFYFPVIMIDKVMSTCLLACQMAPFTFLLLSVASVVHPLCHLYTLRKFLVCCKREENPKLQPTPHRPQSRE